MEGRRRTQIGSALRSRILEDGHLGDDADFALRSPRAAGSELSSSLVGLPPHISSLMGGVSALQDTVRNNIVKRRLHQLRQSALCRRRTDAN